MMKINGNASFCPEAEQRMIEFYNKVESEMGMLGFLSDFKDYASKVTENMARVAALLHYFEGSGGDISLIAVEAAIQIISWYVDEYVRLFSKQQESTLVGSEAHDLYCWIKEYCVRNTILISEKHDIAVWPQSVQKQSDSERITKHSLLTA